MPDSFEIVALREFALALAPLGRLTNARRVTELVRQLGWELPGQDLLTLDMRSLTELPTMVAAIPAATTGEDRLVAATELLLAVGEAVDQIRDAVATIEGAYAASGQFLEKSRIREEFPRRTVDFMLASYLSTRHHRADAVLGLLGLLETEQKAADPTTFQSAHIRRVIRWDRFTMLLRDPSQLFVDAYQWGTPGFQSATLLERLTALMHAFGIAAGLYRIPPTIAAALGLAGGDGQRELRVPFTAGGLWDVDYYELGVALARANDGANPPGLAILPYAVGGAATTWPLGTAWQLSFQASMALEGGISAVLLPGKGVRLDAGFLAGTAGAADGQLRLALGPSAARPSDAEIVLFGTPGATRIASRSLTVEALAKTSAGGGEVTVTIELAGAHLVLSREGLDGFLRDALPSEPIEIPFDIGITWSSASGLSFHGSAGLAVTIPVRRTVFGAVYIGDLDLAVLVGGDSDIKAEIAATLGVTVGPFAAIVQGLGLRALAEITPDGSGNLSVLDVDLGFKPPTGIGLSLDTPTARLAGALIIDPDRGRYVGVLELSLLKKFDLTAVGVLTTKLPDGREGFALVVVISVVFPTAIPIAYNFRLAGVGGLLGLNRSMDVDRLRSGLQTGAVDSILFPADVVRNLDRIVTDLEQVCPPNQGQFLVGPMALIIWNDPPLIRAKVGIIIEFSHPVRVALLGVLRAALPSEDEPILDLKVNFLGTLDIEAGILAFDASIYDSSFGKGDWKFAFEGDLALRLSWGKQQDFVATVGGFHPAYRPPSYLKLPALKPITISLLQDNPRLALTSYFAITTNTVQFGSHLDFYFKKGKFSVVGTFGFDTLFVFCPFHFVADVDARLSVRVGGEDILSISLDFSLQGPSPWIAHGKAKFKVLFVSVTVEFDKTFGEEVQQVLQDVAVLPLLLAELQKDSAWKGELSEGASQLVRLAEWAASGNGPVIDAAGVITVDQSVVPLDTELALFGQRRPSDVNRITIAEARVGGAPVDARERQPVLAPFAPALFHELSDTDKLRAPSFEKMPSGVRIRVGGEDRTDRTVPRAVAYEVKVSDAGAAPRPRRAGERRAATPPFPRREFERLSRGGSIRNSPLSRARASAAESGKVLTAAAGDESFAVVRSSDLRPIDAKSTGLSYATAQERLRILVGQGRSANELQVLPDIQAAA